MKKSQNSSQKRNSRSNSNQKSKNSKSSSQNNNNQCQYRQKYKEIELIGKGTSGSATLVRHILERKYYISKKIRLAHLSQSDRDNAQQELRLLQELKHPNIVEFKESFQDADNLIIIMEYCEDGDLQYHIKRKQDTLDTFSEETILNWFLQILMALDFIHSKKVLHRDIKASNIFVSQCGSVKIGDFGIAKQLDNTIDKAQTLVGTPYYLSPEVCENKPYTYQSDIWALGCLLYELCTLNHPFSSGNLMTLVMKIINNQVEDIPKKYSQQLNILTKLMLEKNPELRPSSQDVLCTQIMLDVMKNFINKKGNVTEQVPIKKLNIHKKKENVYIQAKKQNQGQQLPKIEQQQQQQKKSGGSKKKEEKLSDMELKIQSQMNKIQSEVKQSKKDILEESLKKQKSEGDKSQTQKQKIEDKEKYYEKLMSQQQNSVKNSYKELKSEKQKKNNSNNNNNQEISKNKIQQIKQQNLNMEKSVEDQIGNQKIDGSELAKINREIVKQSQIQEETRLSQKNLENLSKQNQENQQEIDDTKHLQMSQQTVVSVQVSERKNSLQSMNLDVTYQSMNMSVSNNIGGDNNLSLFQKAQLQKEEEEKQQQRNQNNLDNISEQTDEQSQQNTVNESSINNKNDESSFASSENLKKQEETPTPKLSVDKINYMNLSFKSPSFYFQNNSFLQESKLKDEDFNMSLTNNSAFNWKENVSKQIQEQKQKENEQNNNNDNNNNFNKNIEDNSFLKDSQMSLSMTASKPMELTKGLTSFNISQQTNLIKVQSEIQDKTSSNIHQALSNHSKELFDKEFKSGLDNISKLDSIRTDASFDPMTVTMQLNRNNEINSMEQKYDILQSKQSHRKSDEQEEQELELLEVREDIGGDSSDDREDTTIDQTDDTQIEEYSKDEKDIYNVRITKSKQFDELDDVLKLYKSQLQQSLIVTETFNNKLLKMSEIKETSAEYQFSNSDISNQTK